MKLTLAFKAFLKAFKQPEEAKKFLEETKEKEPDHSHLRLLALLQKSSRLVDFFKEDLSKFNDTQIGAAARKIHADANKSIEDLLTIRPLLKEEEGTSITIPKGYDPSEIRVVGKVKGEPPFQGIIRHKGWKAHKHSLPKQVGDYKQDVIYPAEIEVK